MDINHRKTMFQGIFLATFYALCESITALPNCPQRCTCRYGMINKRSLDVNCNGASLQTFPTTLPNAQTYSLSFSNNNISTVEYRPYLDKTDYLDLSDNNLGDFTEDISTKLFAQLRYLYLHKNKLKCLPRKVQEIDLSQMHKITLNDNPWDCDCLHEWMKSWVLDLGEKLQEQPLECSNSKQNSLSSKELSDPFDTGRLETRETKSFWNSINCRYFIFILVMILMFTFAVYACFIVLLIYRNPQRKIPVLDDYSQHKLALLNKAASEKKDSLIVTV